MLLESIESDPKKIDMHLQTSLVCFTITGFTQSTLIHRVVDVAIEFTQPLPEIPNWKEFKITTL